MWESVKHWKIKTENLTNLRDQQKQARDSEVGRTQVQAKTDFVAGNNQHRVDFLLQKAEKNRWQKRNGRGISILAAPDISFRS